jgi:hypothetical protein
MSTVPGFGWMWEGVVLLRYATKKEAVSDIKFWGGFFYWFFIFGT